MITTDIQTPASKGLMVCEPDPVTVVLALNESMNSSFGGLLEERGFNPVAVVGAEDVLKLVRRVQADLVVLDLDGVDHVASLCRALRRSTECGHVAILGVTEAGSTSAQAGAQHAVDSLIVAGRERPEELMRRIETLTELAHLRRSVAQAGSDARIVTNLPMAVLAVDRIGTISHANPMAARLLGAREETLTGQSILALIQAEYGSVWMHAMNTVLTARAYAGPLQMKLVRRDAEFGDAEFDAEMHIARTSWQGHPGLLVTLTDTSDRMAVQAEVEADQRQSLMHARRSLAAGARRSRRLGVTLAEDVLAPLQSACRARQALPAEELDSILATINSLVAEFAAPALLHAGLTTGLGRRLAELAETSGRAVVFESEIGHIRMAAEIEDLLFRLATSRVARALTTATRASVYLWQERSVLCLEIDHDGAANGQRQDREDLSEILALGGNLVLDGGYSGNALYLELPLMDNTGTDPAV